MRADRARCSQCGTSDQDWVGNPQAYVGILHQCQGCAAIDLARSETPDSARGIQVRLITDDEYARRQAAREADEEGGDDEHS